MTAPTSDSHSGWLPSTRYSPQDNHIVVMVGYTFQGLSDGLPSAHVYLAQGPWGASGGPDGPP